MTALTLPMRGALGGTWTRVVAYGLLGAGVATYLSLVGIVGTFHRQQLVFGVVTIGQSFLLLTGILIGYVAARRTNRGALRTIGAGALAGVVTGLGPSLLVLIGPEINLRSVFLRADPVLYNILTLGTFGDGPHALLVPLVGGLLLGTGAAAVALLPAAMQRAFALAIVALLMLGVLSGFIRNPLLSAPFAELRDLGRALTASQGLQVQGAVVVLSTTLGYGIGAWLGGRLGGRRGGAAGGAAGGLLLSLLGGVMLAVPGAVIGGALGLVGGAILGALAERTLVRTDTGARYGALPQTQRRLALSPFLLLALLLIIALPHAAGGTLAAIVVLVSLYMMMGFGLNITLGLAGLLDLGFVAFFAMGAYTVGIMTSAGQYGLLNLPTLSVPTPIVLAVVVTIGALALAAWVGKVRARHMLALALVVGLGALAVLTFAAPGQMILGPFWFTIPVAVFVAFLFGAFLGLPVLGIRGDYLAIATLGFGEIVAILARSNVLIPLIGGPQGVTLIPSPFIVAPTHPLAGPNQIYYLALIFAAFIAFFSFRLRDSRLGRAWLAMREDEDVAEALGINLVQTKLLAYSLGAAFAGLGGALWAAHFKAIFPSDINLFVSINVAALIIIGGMGSIPGVVLGAMFLIGVPEILRDVGGAEYRFLFYGVALIMMMRVRPEGLFPSRVIQRELHVEEENVEAEGATVGESVAAPEGALYPPDVHESPAAQAGNPGEPAPPREPD